MAFERTINNQYLDFFIDPSFQGVNRLFVLSFKNEDDRAVHKILSPNCRNKEL